MTCKCNNMGHTARKCLAHKNENAENISEEFDLDSETSSDESFDNVMDFDILSEDEDEFEDEKIFSFEDFAELEGIALMLQQVSEEGGDCHISMANETSFLLKEIKDTKDLWIADTGATCHLTNRADGMINLTSSDKEICMGNKTKSTATKQGTLMGVAMQANDTTSTVTLDEVSVVPELGFSLISITKAMKNGCKLTGDKNGIILSKGDFTLTFDRIIESGSGYLLAVEIKHTETEEAAIALSEGTTISYKEFHDMLGHLGVDLVKSTAKAMGIKLTGKVEKCEDCAISKAKQHNFSQPLQLHSQ